MRQLQPKPSHH